jgi:hypothetical protein
MSDLERATADLQRLQGELEGSKSHAQWLEKQLERWGGGNGTEGGGDGEGEAGRDDTARAVVQLREELERCRGFAERLCEEKAVLQAELETRNGERRAADESGPGQGQEQGQGQVCGSAAVERYVCEQCHRVRKRGSKGGSRDLQEELDEAAAAASAAAATDSGDDGKANPPSLYRTSSASTTSDGEDGELPWLARGLAGLGSAMEQLVEEGGEESGEEREREGDGGGGGREEKGLVGTIRMDGSSSQGGRTKHRNYESESDEDIVHGDELGDFGSAAEEDEEEDRAGGGECGRRKGGGRGGGAASRRDRVESQDPMMLHFTMTLQAVKINLSHSARYHVDEEALNKLNGPTLYEVRACVCVCVCVCVCKRVHMRWAPQQVYMDHPATPYMPPPPTHLLSRVPPSFPPPPKAALSEEIPFFRWHEWVKSKLMQMVAIAEPPTTPKHSVPLGIKVGETGTGTGTRAGGAGGRGGGGGWTNPLRGLLQKLTSGPTLSGVDNLLVGVDPDSTY